MSLPALSFSRVRLHLRAQETAVLPGFLGSTLRGALGRGLAAVVKDDERSELTRALLGESCPFLRHFGPPRSQGRDQPRALRILPPQVHPDPVTWAPGERLTFGLVLFGEAQGDLPWFIAGLLSAATVDLGADRAPFELVGVETWDGQPLWRPEQAVPPGWPPEERWEDLATPVGSLLHLRFETPAVLLQGGDRVSTLSAESLVRALIRRLHPLLRDVCQVPLGLEPALALTLARSVTTLDAQVEETTVTRFSGRTGRTQRYPAVLGEVLLSGGALPELAPFWHLAPIVGLGKQTAFGLGTLRLVG